MTASIFFEAWVYPWWLNLAVVNPEPIPTWEHWARGQNARQTYWGFKNHSTGLPVTDSNSYVYKEAIFNSMQTKLIKLKLCVRLVLAPGAELWRGTAETDHRYLKRGRAAVIRRGTKRPWGQEGWAQGWVEPPCKTQRWARGSWHRVLLFIILLVLTNGGQFLDQATVALPVHLGKT